MKSIGKYVIVLLCILSFTVIFFNYTSIKNQHKIIEDISFKIQGQQTEGFGNNIVIYKDNLYIAFMSNDYAEIKVIKYSLIKNSVIQESIVSSQYDDPHYAPNIAIDSKGIVHIAYGGWKMPLVYRHSIEPEDISKWSDEEYPTPNGGEVWSYDTYPIIHVDSDDLLYIFYRSNTYQTEKNRRPSGALIWKDLKKTNSIWSDNKVLFTMKENKKFKDIWFYPRHLRSIPKQGRDELVFTFNWRFTNFDGTFYRKAGLVWSPNGGEILVNGEHTIMDIPINQYCLTYIDEDKDKYPEQQAMYGYKNKDTLYAILSSKYNENESTSIFYNVNDKWVKVNEISSLFFWIGSVDVKGNYMFIPVIKEKRKELYEIGITTYNMNNNQIAYTSIAEDYYVKPPEVKVYKDYLIVFYVSQNDINIVIKNIKKL